MPSSCYIYIYILVYDRYTAYILPIHTRIYTTSTLHTKYIIIPYTVAPIYYIFGCTSYYTLPIQHMQPSSHPNPQRKGFGAIPWPWVGEGQDLEQYVYYTYNLIIQYLLCHILHYMYYIVVYYVISESAQRRGRCSGTFWAGKRALCGAIRMTAVHVQNWWLLACFTLYIIKLFYLTSSHHFALAMSDKRPRWWSSSPLQWSAHVLSRLRSSSPRTQFSLELYKRSTVEAEYTLW